MKNLILKIVLFACIAFSAVESKAFNIDLYWNNTTSLNLKIDVYDASGSIIKTLPTCCLGSNCFFSFTLPEYIIITDVGTGCSICRFSVSSASQTCNSASGCSSFLTGGAGGAPVQYASYFAPGGTCSAPNNYQLTVTAV